MMKDSFEQAFRRLPWRRPPASLKQRIFAAPGERRKPILRIFFDQRIPLGWAAALACCAGILGHATGRVRQPETPLPSLLGQADLRIIESEASKNFFDLSQDPQDPWPGPLNLSIPSNPEGSG